jgi:iron complex transport system permease protein
LSAHRFILRGRRGLSIRADRRTVGLLCGLAIAMVVVLVLAVALGEYDIPVADVLATIFGNGDGGSDFIVLELRLPRALTAVLAGAALGMAGAIFQEVTRNALVSPDVVGVSGGAAVAAAGLIILGSADAPAAVPLAALAGALASGAALYLLAWRGGVDGFRIVLVGIGIAALANAGVSYILTRGRVFEVADAYVWLVGTVNGRSWDQVIPLAAVLAALAPVALGLARRMDALTLGDDLARSLGLDVERTRTGMLFLAIVLTAVAVASAGPIGFVAFVAPHLARRLLRSRSSQGLLPAAALVGGLMVLACDLGTRLLFAPTEVPVGLVTSIVAAPYFLFLLRRANRLGAAG